MADTPSSQILMNEALVRSLVSIEMPGSAHLALTRGSSGWDNEMWRLGERLAVRLPRRELAAPLIAHERRALPLIAARIEAAGVRVPVPVCNGRPTAEYPWEWSIVPWFPGDRAIGQPRTARTAWAETLARAISALHIAAPEDPPRNAYRGRPLVTRDETIMGRLEELERADLMSADAAKAARAVWREGVDAARWPAADVWIHGDMHPGNLIVSVDGRRLSAIIDFGDVTAGDPAYDLAVAWLAFDGVGRRLFRATVREHAQWSDPHVWTRARAWAVAMGALILAHSDDDAQFSALGSESLAEALDAL